MSSANGTWHSLKFNGKLSMSGNSGCSTPDSFHGGLTFLIGAVSPTMLEQYREERRTDGLAVATLDRHLALLKHVFSFAVKEDWLEKSPARRVKLEKENNARDRILSAEELTRCKHTQRHTYKRST